MCLLATCGIFWEEALSPRDLTCPCGHRYWDFFQERFVDRDSRSFNTDGRALPMEDRETTLRKEMAPGAFEAGIRAQFIVHCMDCGIRRRMDEGVLGAGFDPPSFLRAMAELREIANGDYTSRGRSITFQEVPTALPTRPQETSRRTRQPSFSDATADSRRSTRSPPVLEQDRLSLRPTPKAQQDALLTRVPSTEGGSRTSSASQRIPPRVPPPSITSPAEVGRANRDPTSRTMRSNEEPGSETQSSPRSSRDESRPSTALGDESAEDGSAPRPTLSALLAKFVAFGDNHYASIATFCENNPEIWDEDSSSLHTAIRYYRRRGDADPARRLAQRLLMLTLSWRRSRTSADQQRWLNKLSRNSQLREELDEKVETLLASLG